MTNDTDLGKAYFIYTNRNWPNPKTKWEDLSPGAQYLWIERAKKAAERTKKEQPLSS